MEIQPEGNFSDWLIDELKKRGWLQADLERESGVSSAQISRVISGTRGVDSNSLRAFSKALGIPQWYVFLQAGLLTEKPREMSDMNYKVARLAADLNSLTDEQLEQVLPLYENILKLAKK